MRVKFNIESLYKIFIFLLIAMYILEATSIPNVNNSLFHDVIQYSALLVAIIYIVIRKYSNKELIRNSFLVLIGILCYVSSGFSGLLMTVLAIIIMPNNYLEIILKMILKEETILFGIIVIFSLLGVLDMGGVKINKGSYITDGVSLGFTHPNMLAAQGTSIILLYLCLNKDKLKTRHYIVSLMCEILLFVLSKGRTSFFLGIFAIILIGMSKMNIIKKIILKFLPFAYWAILGALIFCMFIYARDNGTSAISGLINDGFFNGRIGLAYRSLLVYPITIFGIYRLRTCHWYIYDHCNIMSNYKKRDDQIFIYLSHGWGYKAAKGGSLENCKSKFDYMTATGPVSAEGLSKYWNSDIKNTIVTGYPRLDYFFGEDSSVLNHIDNIWKFDTYTKVFFWMPTFRQSTNQALTENYIKSETGLPILETLDMLKKLDSLLSNINVLLVFKIHHLQLELPVFNNKFNNIIFINDEELRNNNIQLYQLIKCADALISDYSSISIDYLLLDRPIIYTLDDYEQYDKSRGLFPHNAIDYMPGYHVYTVEELNNSIIEIRKGIDRYSDDRKLVMNNYHTYRDGNSSRRILDMFDIKK